MALGVVALLFLLRAFTAGVEFDLPNRLQDFASLSISVVIESFPFVVVGILLSIVVQVWLPEGALLKVLPRQPALRRAGISFLGVFFPVCECGNVPLARAFMLRGFTVADSVTFLVAAPILNPITIITTYQAFGWNDGILIARILGGFAIANVLGWMYSRHPDPETLLTTAFGDACAVAAHDGHDHRSLNARIDRSLSTFVAEARAVLPALVVGSLIAGGIQVFVSRDVLLSVGSDPVLSVLALMALAFIVAVCSNVDAFFVLSFGGSFLPGSIVAFLLFGPVIDVKMLALMRTTFRARTLAQIAVVVALISASIGLAVNLLA